MKRRIKPGRSVDNFQVEVRKLKDRRRMIIHCLAGNPLYTHLYRVDVGKRKLGEIDKRLIEIGQLRRNKWQMEGETWATVSDHENYMISSLGRVKTQYGHLMHPALGGQSRAYLRVTLNGKSCLLHRLVAKAFVPNNLGLPEVNHKDFNKLNNRADNLEWCTRKENMDHAVAAGRIIHGTNHSDAKLTENDVREIRRLRSEGITVTSLAKKFNMNSGQISRVANRIYWKHVL